MRKGRAEFCQAFRSLLLWTTSNRFWAGLFQTRPPESEESEGTRTELCAESAASPFIKRPGGFAITSGDTGRFVLLAGFQFPSVLLSGAQREQFRALRTKLPFASEGIARPAHVRAGDVFIFRQAGAGTFSGAHLLSLSFAAVCPPAMSFARPMRKHAVPKKIRPVTCFDTVQKRFGVENFHRKRVDFTGRPL